VLLHLVDLSSFEGSALDDLTTVEHELTEFNAELLERPRLLVGSKLDAARPERQEELRRAAAERGLPYREISSATREGISGLIADLAKRLQAPVPAP
jgi:GTP-binding protein